MAAADKLDNATSIIRDDRIEGAAIWSRFNASQTFCRRSGKERQTVVDGLAAEACRQEEWLLVEAWDES